LFLLGAGTGLFFSANNAVTLDSAPAAEAAATSGLLWAASFLGVAIGAALGSVMVHDAPPGVTPAILERQADCYKLLALVGILGTMLCWVRPDQGRGRQP
jgi:MFS family permease